ncbi:DUF493 domain-containing protein [Polaribacter pacificus]|uniref:DUF493 domain-containing protein n=1 Tax=Polaribacter pacificus TaxID=1775173 RepID=A0A917I1R1_9FLAO|nr:DUF493 domain-containing protein [Polaribacter pacificus]GGH03596.1 DUF493 domain-containing protein [Polaribacter pacificus]
MTDKESFYIKLKDSLEDTTSFPADYLYKFIVPTAGDQEKEVEAIFKATAATYDTKFSKTGKYVSVSIELVVESADQVIAFYKKAEKIEGIISL